MLCVNVCLCLSMCAFVCASVLWGFTGKDGRPTSLSDSGGVRQQRAQVPGQESGRQDLDSFVCLFVCLLKDIWTFLLYNDVLMCSKMCFIFKQSPNELSCSLTKEMETQSGDENLIRVWKPFLCLCVWGGGVHVCRWSWDDLGIVIVAFNRHIQEKIYMKILKNKESMMCLCMCTYGDLSELKHHLVGTLS